MKVLFVASDNNASSGAFLSMVKLTSLLRNEFGVQTSVVVPRDGEGVKLLEENNIPYQLIKSYDWVVSIDDEKKLRKKIKHKLLEPYNYSAISSLTKKIKDEHYDLVHLNTTYAYVGAVAALQAGVPFVWHLREMLEEDQGRQIYNRKAGYALINKANRVIAISTAVYDKYEPLISKGKLIKIFNGIDTDRFYNPGKTIIDKTDTFTLIYGGGYAIKKGIYELGSALNFLKQNGIDNFQLYLIGEPNEKYRAYLHQTGLDANVKYLGYQKNVERWYNKSDIAFSCSAMEAFGRKTVEAMLCGCLMIASNTGGSLDIIEDKKTGYFYQQGDPLSLAYTILYAMNHVEESRAIAQAGREYARKHFSALENAHAIYNTYKDVLQNP